MIYFSGGPVSGRWCVMGCDVDVLQIFEPNYRFQGSSYKSSKRKIRGTYKMRRKEF